MMYFHHQDSAIHYNITGSGSPLVLLHGFLWNAQVWAPFLPLLTQKHKVITVDLCGHGKSDSVCDGYSVETMADGLAQILAHEKVEKVRLVGHSMGGYVGLAFAERHPAQLEELVLLHSTPKADSAERKTNRNRAISLVQRHKHAFVRMGIVNLFDNETMPSETEIDKAVSAAEKIDTQSIVAALRSMKNRTDRTEILNLFKGKKTIIAGKKDALIPFDSIQKIAQDSNCRFIAFPGSHMAGFFENKNLLQVFFEAL